MTAYARCATCHVTFLRGDAFLEHLAEHARGRVFVCPWCAGEFEALAYTQHSCAGMDECMAAFGVGQGPLPDSRPRRVAAPAAPGRQPGGAA